MKRKLFRIGIITTLVFATLVVSKIHGYSFSIWHRFIDNTPEKEVLIGRTKGTRVDDYGLDIPMEIAQVVANPAYPKVNPLIGLDGQQMYLPFKTLIQSPAMIFRPSAWGFVLGVDYGLAWMWAFMVLGLFFSSLLLFAALTANFRLSCWGALLVILSPYFHAWAFHKSEIFIHGIGVFLGLFGLVKAEKRIHRLGAAGFAGWSAGCLVVDILYPPIMIPVIYWILFLSLGLLMQRRRDLHFDRIFVFGSLFALVITLVGVIPLLLEARSFIERIQATSYPGQRVWLGGDLSPWLLFSEHFFLPLVILAKNLDWQSLGNLCEASSFDLFFPVLLVAVLGTATTSGLISGGGGKTRFSPMLLSLMVVILLLLLFGIAGGPEWLAKTSFIGMSLSRRIIAGVGMASLTATILYLNSDFQIPQRRLLLGLGVWFVVLLYSAIAFRREFSGMSNWFFAAAIVFQMYLAFLLLKRDRKFLPLLCFVHLPYVASNPIAHGGMDYIVNNPLTHNVREIEAGDPSARWIAINGKNASELKYSAFFSSYFRMIGSPSVGGYNCPPDVRLLAALFPFQSELSPTLNQCAYFIFQLVDDGEPAAVEQAMPGVLILKIHRIHLNTLASLGVRNFLFLSRDNASEPMDLGSSLEFKGRVDNKSLYHWSGAR